MSSPADAVAAEWFAAWARVSTGEDVEPRQRYEGVKFRPMRGRPSKLYASVVRTRRPVTAAGSEPIIPYSSEDV